MPKHQFRSLATYQHIWYSYRSFNPSAVIIDPRPDEAAFPRSRQGGRVFASNVLPLPRKEIQLPLSRQVGGAAGISHQPLAKLSRMQVAQPCIASGDADCPQLNANGA
jgi:hypothetical protein